MPLNNSLLMNPLANPLSGLRPLGASYQPDPFAQPPLTPEEEQTLISSLLRSTMGGLEAVGYGLDTPGAYLRGVLAGTPGERVGGRDLLTSWGLTSPNDPNAWEWADVAGLGADILFDPLTFLTAGGSALSKAGKVAKAAGIGADDLAKLATKKAGEQLGKKIGPRQARMMLSFDDLQQGLDPRLAGQLKTTLDTMGVNASDLAGQKLGGLFGYDVPFSSVSGVLGGSGAKSQAVAAGLDTAGAALANSWPGRALTQLFDPLVQGTGTAPVQAAARNLSNESRLMGQEVAGQAQEHLNFLENSLAKEFPDLNPVQRNEILKLVAVHDPENAKYALGDRLGRYGLPTPSQGVVDRVNTMQGMFDTLDNELADLSLPTPKWLSEVRERYMPRRKTAAAFGEKSPAKIGGTKVLDLERESDIARNRALDVEGADIAVSRLSVDPTLVGPDALKDNAARASRVMAAHPEMAHELSAPTQSVLTESGKIYVPHEASLRADAPEVMVMVDPQKLDQGWQKGLASLYVPPGKEAVEGRRAGVEQFLKTDQPIQAPRIDLKPNTGAVQFADGRHRFAVLRDAGEREVGVMVPADQADAVRAAYGVPGYEAPKTGADALADAVEKGVASKWKPRTGIDKKIQGVAKEFDELNPYAIRKFAEDSADMRKAEVEYYRDLYTDAVGGRFSPEQWKLLRDEKFDAAAPELRGLKLDEFAQELVDAGLIKGQDFNPGEEALSLLREVGSPTSAKKTGGNLALHSLRDRNFLHSVAKDRYSEIASESRRLSKMTPDEQQMLAMRDRADRLAKYLKTEHPARPLMSDDKGQRVGLFDNHLVQDWETGVRQTKHTGLVARSMIDALAEAATESPIPGKTMQLEGHNNVLDRLGFGRDLTDEAGNVVKDSTGRIVKDTSGVTDAFRARLAELGKNPDSFNIPVEVAQDLLRLRQGMESAPWLEAFDQITRLTKSFLTFSPAFHGRNLSSGQLQNLFTGAYDAVKHPRQTMRAISDSWALSRGKDTKYLHTLPIVKKELGSVSEKEAREWLMDLAVRYEAVDPSIAETVGKEFAGIAGAKTGRKIPANPGERGAVAYNEMDKRSEYILGRGKRDPMTQTEARRGARSEGYDSNTLTQLIPTPSVQQMFGGPDPLSRYKGENPLRAATPILETFRGLGSEIRQGATDVAGRLKQGDWKGAATEALEGPLNSLNVAGVRGETSRNALQRTHERLSQNVELFNRMGGFIGWLQQGVHPAEAAARVRASQVDYKMLSPFEKSVMRRTVPFYSFNRRMAEFVASQLMEKPGGGISQAIQATNTGRTDDSFIPDYVGEGAAIPLGKGTYITGLGLMHEGPLNTVALGTGLGETVHRTAQKMGAQLNPAIKAPIEWATGVNMFTGRPLDELYQFPIEGATSTTAQMANSTLMNSPLSRALTITRKLKDPRKDIPEKALNLLTGVNITTLSGGIERAKEMEARKALEELLKKTPGVRTMENVYIKAEDLAKLSPEEQRAYAMHRLMLKRAREAAKKKREAAK